MFGSRANKLLYVKLFYLLNVLYYCICRVVVAKPKLKATAEIG